MLVSPYVVRTDSTSRKMRTTLGLREFKNAAAVFLTNPSQLNKSAIRDAILVQLRAELALQVGAAQLARDEAISEESRAESKYDTHSQEAAYLAEGQAKLAGEIEESITHYASLPLPDFGPGTAIALGALVELGAPRGSSWYFLGPRA
ncbi:MAG: hypothetical protein NTV51_00695, partial [Verrucomicrobia bacterium]|nr:hypothetical protein [Verrucomicrobiota bacterium]